MAEELAKDCELYARTDTTAATSSDLVGGVTELNLSFAHTMANTTYLGNGGYETEKPTTTKVTGSITVNKNPDDEPQALIFTASRAKSLLHLTVIDNPAASAGSKGFRYPVYVSQQEDPRNPTELKTSNFSISLGGAPVAV